MSRLKKVVATSVLALVCLSVAVACTNKPPLAADSQSKEQQLTQDYYKKQSEKVPYPLEQVNDSQERRNLREKLLRFNKPDKLGYIYMLSNTGEVVSFYTVKGKVSSTQSMMTATNQNTYVCQKNPWVDQQRNDKDAFICDWATTPAPGDDGSYGENEQGIFWFDTNDVYHTWNGLYHYADAPVKIDSVTHRMEGVEEGAQPSSVGEPIEQRSNK